MDREVNEGVGGWVWVRGWNGVDEYKVGWVWVWVDGYVVMWVDGCG